jgi:hypothetical protein
VKTPRNSNYGMVGKVNGKKQDEEIDSLNDLFSTHNKAIKVNTIF